MEKRGQLNWREALHFITQIMKALSHSHSHDIIHRDIKPQNIMVLRDGSVKVADFGIACLANSANTLTQEALGSVQRRVAEQQEKSRGDEISPEELAKETSKETILKKLVRAEKKAKFGSTDWMKIVALEADYNKIKQDEIDTENNTIHFHLPVDYPTCKEDCLLFKNNLCKGGK